jgi:hypothetical protein
MFFLDISGDPQTGGYVKPSVLRSLLPGQRSDLGAQDSGGEEFSLKELYAIQEIQSQTDLLRLLVQ